MTRWPERWSRLGSVGHGATLPAVIDRFGAAARRGQGHRRWVARARARLTGGEESGEHMCFFHLLAQHGTAHLCRWSPAVIGRRSLVGVVGGGNAKRRRRFRRRGAVYRGRQGVGEHHLSMEELEVGEVDVDDGRRWGLVVRWRGSGGGGGSFFLNSGVLCKQSKEGLNWKLGGV